MKKIGDSRNQIQSNEMIVTSGISLVMQRIGRLSTQRARFGHRIEIGSMFDQSWLLELDSGVGSSRNKLATLWTLFSADNYQRAFSQDISDLSLQTLSFR